MSEALYFRHPSSVEHDTGAHPEGPGRIPAIERALEQEDWLGYSLREAPAVEIDVLRRVHPQHHVEAVRAMSERGGGAFDPDTLSSAGSYEAALHAAGGACAMVEELLGGRARTAFCGLRPPGHHAEPETAMGFCLFNNVAVAARHAIDALGTERVLIVDWDVHHGNGTNDIFHSSRQVLFASIHQSPLYPGTGPLSDSGSGEGEGYTINMPVPPGSDGNAWRALLDYVVAPVARAFDPDLVLVSAGFDAHWADPLADCRLETASFGHMARRMGALASEVGAPLGAVLEGGYDLEALASSVVAALEGFSSTRDPAPATPDAITERVAEHVRRHWPI